MFHMLDTVDDIADEAEKIQSLTLLRVITWKSWWIIPIQSTVNSAALQVLGKTIVPTNAANKAVCQKKIMKYKLHSLKGPLPCTC